MYQLLIVDDEIHTAHGIETGFDWGEMGFSKIYVAYNIRQAKAILMDNPIDVMISDIEMPQGNGLELLKWVKEHYPTVESLLLTCHTDFGYARQAIQLGSLDYLLKPVHFEELKVCVTKALQKIDKERNGFIEQFWLNLINQSIPFNREQIKEILLEHNIRSFETSKFVPILFTVVNWQKAVSSRQEEMMEYVLRSEVDAALKLSGIRGHSIPFVRGSLLFIIPTDGSFRVDREQLKIECMGYINSYRERFECDMSCYIGNPVFINEMQSMVDSLLKASTDNVTLINQVLQLHEVDQRLEQANGNFLNMNTWVEMLKQGTKEVLLEEIQAYMASIKRDGCSVKMLHDFYQNYLQMIYYVLQLKGLQAHRICSGNLSTERTSYAVRSVDNLQEWAKHITETAINFIQSVKESHKVVDRVKQYISENIDRELMRDDIAALVFLNPDYLTRLFKKETGLSISEYFLEERVKIAKDLLIKTDLPISQIALSSGYANFSHFSQMFRKKTQMNPLDYRKSQRKIT